MDLGSGSGVKPIWSGDSESGILVGMFEAARSRVGVGSGRDHETGSDPRWPGSGVYGSFKR